MSTTPSSAGSPNAAACARPVCTAVAAAGEPKKRPAAGSAGSSAVSNHSSGVLTKSARLITSSAVGAGGAPDASASARSTRTRCEQLVGRRQPVEARAQQRVRARAMLTRPARQRSSAPTAAVTAARLRHGERRGSGAAVAAVGEPPFARARERPRRTCRPRAAAGAAPAAAATAAAAAARSGRAPAARLGRPPLTAGRDAQRGDERADRARRERGAAPVEHRARRAAAATPSFSMAAARSAPAAR